MREDPMKKLALFAVGAAGAALIGYGMRKAGLGRRIAVGVSKARKGH